VKLTLVTIILAFLGIFKHKKKIVTQTQTFSTIELYWHIWSEKDLLAKACTSLLQNVAVIKQKHKQID
jgi:hypothetical protein